MRIPGIHKSCHQRTRGGNRYCKKSQNLPNLNFEHVKLNRIYCQKHNTSIIKENFTSADYLRQGGSQTAGKLTAKEGKGWILPCWTSAPPQTARNEANAQCHASPAEGRTRCSPLMALRSQNTTPNITWTSQHHWHADLKNPWHYLGTEVMLYPDIQNTLKILKATATWV